MTDAQRRIEVRSPSSRAVFAGALLAGLALFLVLFQWNWLRGPLASYMSARLHRPVRIVGDLHVHPWSGNPWARVGGVVVGGDKAAGRAATGPGVRSARLTSLTVGWKWWPLLRGQAVLPLVAVRGAALDLVAGPPGPAAKSGPAGSPRIDHLVIEDGRVSYVDPLRRVAFTGVVATDERREPAPPGLTTIRGRLVIGGADWAGPRPVLDAPRLLIGVRLLPLMGGSLQLPLIEADSPRAHLVRDANGRGNWETGQKAAAPKAPSIGRLIIRDGVIDYTDARAKLELAGTVSTTETVGAYGQGAFALRGQGALNREPFVVRLSGGPLVKIDPRRPYPFDADVTAGLTHISARGAIVHPFHFDAVSGVARVRGADLADLFVLTRVALPSTPPYDLSAGFARRGDSVALRNIVGRMGRSDLEGALAIEKRGGRPLVRGDLVSRRLRLTDLTALVGGVPKNAGSQALSPLQRVTAAKLAAEHRILPDAHLQLDRIRGTDAAVTYRASQVDAGRLPVRSLLLQVRLDHGRLDIDPLRISLPRGSLVSTIHLDARGATPAETVDARLADARLEQLVPPGRGGPAIEGSLFARARLNATGDSVRAAGASANGSLSIAVPGGQIRQAFAELLGIDATKGLFLLLSKNEKQTPIRCAVADFQARDGVFTARRIVLDTGVVLATGSGDIDLRNESLRLRLAGKPKKFRLIRIGAPITLGGTLASPHVGVDVAKAAPQVLVGAAFGALLAPASALLAFVNPGLAKNADCSALLAASN